MVKKGPKNKRRRKKRRKQNIEKKTPKEKMTNDSLTEKENVSV
jgi:hypothetical protein